MKPITLEENRLKLLEQDKIVNEILNILNGCSCEYATEILEIAQSKIGELSYVLYNQDHRKILSDAIKNTQETKNL